MRHDQLTDMTTFSHYDTATGRSSTHPRPRCSCGGILDSHQSKDEAVCRSCGAEITGAEHAKMMKQIVDDAEARQ